MHKYRLVAKKGEGTFSEVLKAQCIKTSKYVAIKCMKNHFGSLDQVNNLREIQALRRLSPFPNVVTLLEVLYDQPSGRLALVFELMDMNIYELIRGRRHYLAEDFVRSYMWQLMKAMDHMHRNGIFHRDIKPENILVMDDCLKLADFGSCRGIFSKQPYTEYISTRWYRAPECLLTDGYYSYKMDMWGVGCVFFEIVALFPLFPGANEADQLQKIHAVLGTPPPEIVAKFRQRSDHSVPQASAPRSGTGIATLIPHCSGACIDLVEKLLHYDPEQRLSARQALKHPYFKDLREKERWEARAKQAAEQQAASSEASLAPSRGISHPISSTCNDAQSASSSCTHKSSRTAACASEDPAPRISDANDHFASQNLAAHGLPSIGAMKGQQEAEEVAAEKSAAATTSVAATVPTGGSNVATGGRARHSSCEEVIPLAVATAGLPILKTQTSTVSQKRDSKASHIAQAYSMRHANKTKKAPAGHISGVRRRKEASSITSSHSNNSSLSAKLSIGPSNSSRMQRHLSDSTKNIYGSSRYRVDN